MSRHRRRSGPWGFTLPQLLFLTLLLGLLAAVLGTLEGDGVEPAPPRVVEEELRALLRGAEHFAAARSRWPESLTELVEAGFYEPGGEVAICRLRFIPGTRSRAPYMLIHAAHPDSRRVVFTAYPIWGGRIYDYQARAPGCAGL